MKKLLSTLLIILILVNMYACDLTGIIFKFQIDPVVTLNGGFNAKSSLVIPINKFELGISYECFAQAEYTAYSALFDYHWIYGTFSLLSGIGLGYVHNQHILSPELNTEIRLFILNDLFITYTGNLKYRGELSDNNPNIINKNFKAILSSFFGIGIVF